MPRLPFALLLLIVIDARAQDACETRCNQLASECLKVCVGDPKEAAKAGQANRMTSCLKSCNEKAVPCRAACKPATP